ncbi:MAG: ACP phosphodiesterase [Microcystaceae cyanobacterium]
MNYLAHIYLADQTPESRLGNFLGDFVKGSLDNYREQYDPLILKGIQTHRQVDYFTDHHPIFQQSKRRIVERHRYFSGILIDIFYDHFLALHWRSFSTEALGEFIADFYLILEQNYHLLPIKLQRIFPMIKRENWLLSYQGISGIKTTCQRLSRRIKRENTLKDGHQDLIKYYEEIESDFLLFFPKLIDFVQQREVIQG